MTTGFCFSRYDAILYTNTMATPTYGVGARRWCRSSCCATAASPAAARPQHAESVMSEPASSTSTPSPRGSVMRTSSARRGRPAAGALLGVLAASAPAAAQPPRSHCRRAAEHRPHLRRRSRLRRRQRVRRDGDRARRTSTGSRPQGLRFTDAHAPAATCTPSRYALLTGEYAWRRKGTGVLPGNARAHHRARPRHAGLDAARGRLRDGRGRQVAPRPRAAPTSTGTATSRRGRSTSGSTTASSSRRPAIACPASTSRTAAWSASTRPTRSR